MSLPGQPAGAVQTCPNCQIGWLVQVDATVIDREGHNWYVCESSSGGCGFQVKSPAFFPPGRRGPLSPPRHAERRHPFGSALGLPRPRRGGIPNTWQASEDIGTRGPVWYDDFKTDRSNQYFIWGDPNGEHPDLAPYLTPEGLAPLGYGTPGPFQLLAAGYLDDVRVTWKARVTVPDLVYMGSYFRLDGNRWIGVWNSGAGDGAISAETDAGSGPPAPNPGYWRTDFDLALDDQLVLVAESRRSSILLSLTVNGVETVRHEADVPDVGSGPGIAIDGLQGIVLHSIQVDAL